MKAQGGKSVYGASLGILMLDAKFPRIPGDMGYAGTWPFPVLYKVISDASPERVVRNRAEGLLEAFIDGARELVAIGADGITTNCGFLSLFQAELQAAVPVPVATSALMQVPMVQATLPKGQRVGVLTISANTLTEDHMAAAGVPLDTPVQGTDSGREFSRVILENELEMDVEAARLDLLDAGDALMRGRDDIGAIVLECTNMVPYAVDLRRRLDVPIYSIYSLIQWFQQGLLPRTFP
ncbi:MAG: aspartate/glutamate racemase family protein [Pseudomonadota bacterium]